MNKNIQIQYSDYSKLIISDTENNIRSRACVDKLQANTRWELDANFNSIISYNLASFSAVERAFGYEQQQQCAT